MGEFLWSVELALFKFFNQTLSSPWADDLVPIMTDLHKITLVKFVLPLGLLALFLKKFGRQGFRYFLILILAVSVSDFVGGRIKKVVLRPRPYQVAETNAIQKAPAGDDRSFYSNHASNMFTAATYLTAFFPTGRLFLFSLATVIALSRVHAGVHYPSDVVFAAMMGILLGGLFARSIRRPDTTPDSPLGRSR